MNSRFLQELAKYGPDGVYPPVDRARAQTYCTRLARSHYENFSVASLLLPRRLLRHFHVVYAYCRWADDLADEAGGGVRALQLLRWWREELLHCYDGQPRHPVLIALQQTIRRYRIPPTPFLDLLFAALMRFEVDRTRDLFYRGFPLLEQLPPSIQGDVELFIHGGLAVLRKIEQAGYNLISSDFCTYVLTLFCVAG